MEFVSHYECTLCHKQLDKDSQQLTCPSCGESGILDVCYDYEAVKQQFTKKSLKENPDPTMWRYQPLMSVAKRDFSDTLRVGGTPLYRSKGLSKKFGLEKLYLKDEGLNPTASLKDRASAVAVMKAIEAGISTISCSSTGNAASSLAGNAARMGLKTVIFVPKRAPKGKLAQLLIYGSTVISVDGDYGDTFKLSKEAIDRYKWYNRNAAINPHMVEGKKTVAFEIAEQLDFDVPDWVVVSVGDGCTIAGVYKGFYDLLQIGFIDKIPKLLAVQATGCAPLHQAFHTGKPFEA
ncbi:MAG: pyridoxal-phosphate dependent enzyme, partial [Vallitaleaceae bacterium]|nr:pyridoxal-phosphate dependent enzyme [Vallitaleaceae bacterium]